MVDRYFTPEQVDALVPELTARMSLVLQLHAHLRATCRALLQQGVRVTPEGLARGEGLDTEGRAQPRVAHARGIHDAAREAMAEIEATGALIKDVEVGLVDFPSWLDGREQVVLCWRLGEAKVAWYHGPDGGFAGREPIAGRRFTAVPAE